MFLEPAEISKQISFAHNSDLAAVARPVAKWIDGARSAGVFSVTLPVPDNFIRATPSGSQFNVPLARLFLKYMQNQLGYKVSNPTCNITSVIATPDAWRKLCANGLGCDCHQAKFELSTAGRREIRWDASFDAPSVRTLKEFDATCGGNQTKPCDCTLLDIKRDDEGILLSWKQPIEKCLTEADINQLLHQNGITLTAGDQADDRLEPPPAAARIAKTGKDGPKMDRRNTLCGRAQPIPNPPVDPFHSLSNCSFAVSWE